MSDTYECGQCGNTGDYDERHPICINCLELDLKTLREAAQGATVILAQIIKGHLVGRDMGGVATAHYNLTQALATPITDKEAE